MAITPINLTILGLDIMPKVFIGANSTIGVGNVPASSVQSFQKGGTQINGGLSIQAVGNTTTLHAAAGVSPLSVSLSDFGSGSSAVFTGLNPTGFTLQAANSATSKVPTLVLTAQPTAIGNGAPATITLPGYTTNDLASGRLTAGFKPDPTTGQEALVIQAMPHP
jgi:hypothetical protein